MERSKLMSQNRDIKDRFFMPIPIVPANQSIEKLPGEEPYGYVYGIINMKTLELYIGSVYSTYSDVKSPQKYSALKKRVTNYLYDYHKLKAQLETGGELDNRFTRPLIRALVEDGIENFVMFPIAETTEANHVEMEKKFIKKAKGNFDSYNVHTKGSNQHKEGVPMSEQSKKDRSEPIILVNPVVGVIMESDSLKLAGDFFGSSKDMMKNTVRRGRTYKNWYIFYADKEKRDDLFNKIMNDSTLTNKEALAEKSKKRYKEIYDMVTEYYDPESATDPFKTYSKFEPLRYLI